MKEEVRWGKSKIKKIKKSKTKKNQKIFFEKCQQKYVFLKIILEGILIPIYPCYPCYSCSLSEPPLSSSVSISISISM
jgi:hypothetical protein